MSIPKEPRQLMINIMYLVLMALLALSLSAEIMNAFLDLDEGMRASNVRLSKSAIDTKEGIQEVLKKKPKLTEPLNNGIDRAIEEVDNFNAYVESIRDSLIGMNGGWKEETKDGKVVRKLKSPENYEPTTRFLVKGGKGLELEEKIKSTKERLLKIFDETIDAAIATGEVKRTDEEVKTLKETFAANFPLNIDENWQEKAGKDKKTWAEYKFYQLPLAASLPVFSKFQNDANSAKAKMVNEFAGLVGGRQLKLNKFFPVMNAKQGYVIQNEKFEATVAIGAYSNEFAKSSSITVNGRRIPLDANGQGTFTETASSLGKKKLSMTANVTNPLTGEKFSGTSEFTYEVGLRSAVVSADKMNVFYVGVPNPVSLTAAGIPSSALQASCSGGGCNMSGSGNKREVRVSSPGQTATITLSGGGLQATKFEFRVKRIPDPVACFRPDGPTGGKMGNGEFKAQQGIIPDLRGFDFDAKCEIVGFQVIKAAPRADVLIAQNSGARFNGRAANLINSAKPGDLYTIQEIKAKCPGDKAARQIPGMSWSIK